MSAVDLTRLSPWRRAARRPMALAVHASDETATREPLEACDRMPTHVAIIMDGNGRWAQERGLRREAGHRAGTENIRRVVETLGRRGVRYVTLFAFSTENWRRPETEVRSLLRLPGVYLRRELKALHAAGVRLRHLGHLEVLEPGLQEQIRQAEQLTKDNDGITLTVAFNYGGRREIVDAMRRIAAEGIPAEQIDERTISDHLDTAGLPDPDLIIRTGGEMRLSNFLLWQSAYAEYYATPTFWPDFDEGEVDAALAAYAGRSRRFGAVVTATGA
jgi:undecaprenyl diphosphate synthase